MASLIKFGLTMELLLLSTGLVSTFFMLKRATTTTPHHLFNMVLFNFSEILNSLKSFLSSPLYICLFINSVVILILTFSKFQHPIKKFLNVFLVEKDDDVSVQPQAYHEKEEYMPNRTNSAIAMDTVMSFFSRYNSHPPVLEDTTIQDEMPCSSLKDTKFDGTQSTSTLPPPQTSWDRLRDKTTTTLPRSQTSWDRLRAKTDSAETTTTTTTAATLPQSQISWDGLRAITDSTQTKHSFPDISHLTEAREILSPRSSNLFHETITSINYQESIEEGELEDDSLEATWKAITKKKELKKSLTFNDALSMSRIGGLRGDISVSTEESNKKFDDFIKKINHERLLQRQESDQRAAHNVNMLNRAR